MVVDVYVKWSKDEAFNRYHVSRGKFDKLELILDKAQEDNILEGFYMQYEEKEEKMSVDVYVKWSKDGEFNRYHVTKGKIYKLDWILHRAKEINIIEEFYMYEIEE